MDKQDLIILLADLDAENAIRSLLELRATELNIRPVALEIKRHYLRDSGCFRLAHEFVRSYLRTHSHALVVFDRHGSGKDIESPEEIEVIVENRLVQNGWTHENCACVVMDPELEIWVWAQSAEVARILGFGSTTVDMNAFLSAKKLLKEGQDKPPDPKKAVEQCLKRAKKPHSARIFSELAGIVPFEGCRDRAFLKFRRTLEAWFGPSSTVL
jgi:hypothetical protein